MLDSFMGAMNFGDLRNKVIFTILMIVLFRFGTHIPVPGVNHELLSRIIEQSGILGFLDLFSGGALAKFSIFAMGITPYINASIIVQLLTPIVPKMQAMQKESESGRKALAQYTRYLTVVLAALQAIGMSYVLSSAIPIFTIFNTITTIIVITAGSVFLMWMGELITERGIGNGASLLIFIGIISRLPLYFGQTFSLLMIGDINLIQVIALFAIFCLAIVAIVWIQLAERKVPIHYAKKVVGRKVYGGQTSYLPLRINTAGVLPIIFAVSILMLPNTIFGFLRGVPSVQNLAIYLSTLFSPDSLLYNFIEFLLIIFFAFFYTAIIYNPVELASNLKKYGGFIPGIRPGKPTSEYFDKVLTRITTLGGLFLGLIALIPALSELLTKVTTFRGLGATALLIVVGVALDTIRQIQAQLMAKQYEHLVK